MILRIIHKGTWYIIKLKGLQKVQPIRLLITPRNLQKKFKTIFGPPVTFPKITTNKQIERKDTIDTEIINSSIFSPLILKSALCFVIFVSYVFLKVNFKK